MQGIDVVIDQKAQKPCFLEVQPTYASGYPWSGAGRDAYKPPFWNPYEPNLVKFLIEEKSTLEKQMPMYYNNWLDKEKHFDLIYGSLRSFLDVRA